MSKKTKIIVLILILSVFFNCLPEVISSVPVIKPDEAIIINHDDIHPLNLSLSEIQDAANLGFYIEHASLGIDLRRGLEALETGNSLYSMQNWNFNYRGNPATEIKLSMFLDNLQSMSENSDLDAYSVISMKLCFMDSASNVEDYIAAMEKVEAAYPDKILVWWTMPVTENSNLQINNFNTRLRQYCSENNKILFDLADIESHDISGNHYEDEKGEYLYSGISNDGAHLDAEGEALVANAFWRLMSEIKKLFP